MGAAQRAGREPSAPEDYEALHRTSPLTYATLWAVVQVRGLVSRDSRRHRGHSGSSAGARVGSRGVAAPRLRAGAESARLPAPRFTGKAPTTTSTARTLQPTEANLAPRGASRATGRSRALGTARPRRKGRLATSSTRRPRNFACADPSGHPRRQLFWTHPVRLARDLDAGAREVRRRADLAARPAPAATGPLGGPR